MTRMKSIPCLCLLCFLTAVGGLSSRAAAPVNDNFADAIQIAGFTISTSGNNSGATKEAGEPNHAFTGGASVWWVWTAPADGSVTIDTGGSTFDTGLGVYTGNSVSGLTVVAQDDDDASLGLQSKVTFDATAGTAYHIAVDGFAAATGSITLNLNASGGSGGSQTTFIEVGAVWKYLDDGSDQGSAWRGGGFNDSGWASGPAELGYGDFDEATTVSYGPDPNNKFTTTYFRRSFSVSGASGYTNLILRIVRDDGAVVYLNGVELVRPGMPGGTINFDTPAFDVVGGGQESAFEEFNLSPTALVDGQNVVAVEVHQNNGNSSDISFNMELIGQTGTVVHQPPVVILTAPLNNGFYSRSVPLNLAAQASGIGATVTNVAFYSGTTRLGADSSSPFSFSWNNLTVGGFILRAVAMDDGGLSSTSPPVSITIVSNFPPSVEITSPTDGSYSVVSNDVLIAADASDLDGSVAMVTFYDGASQVGQDTTSPFSSTLQNPALGVHSLTAVAVDNVGARATSAVVHVTVGENVPVPADLILAGSVWKYLDNGSDQGSTWRAINFDDSGWASGPAQLGYGDGDEATVVGYGPSANNKYITTYFRHSLTVNNPAGYSNLTVRLLRDDGGVVYVNGTEVFRSNMPNGPVDYLTTALGAVAGGDESTTFYSTSVSPGLLVTGNNVVAVEIHQRSGDSSDISFDLGLSGNDPSFINQSPQVAILSPSDGSAYAAPGNISISAGAFDSDGTVTNITLYVGSTRLTDLRAEPFDYLWNNVAVGSYALRAVATDNFGASSTSAVVNVTVAMANTPPSIATVNPPAGTVSNLTQVTVVFSRSVTGVDASDLLINGLPATAVVGANASYTFTFPQPPGGEVTVSWAAGHGIADTLIPPTAFDAGAAGSTWQYFLNDRTPPTVVALDPPASSTVPALKKIKVTFSEPVAGVDASDLLINGTPASSVTGSAEGPYEFGFKSPGPGAVQVSWASSHGIHDWASALNPFAGGAVSYTVNTNTTRVIITEIFYHPPGATEPAGEEFVEIYNRGSNAVNLTGWTLSKAVKFTFPNVSIAPGSYLAIAADLPTFQARHPGVNNVVGGWTGRLSNSDDEVRLNDALGDTEDSVSYADAGEWAVRQRGPDDQGHRGWIWYTAADGLGKSLELVNLALPNARGQNWTSSLPDAGTPGAANSVASANSAPLILDVSHFPYVPRSTDPVTITARVVDEQTNGLSALLFYRNASSASPPPFTTAQMFDDGAHGDGVAGDGIYGAVIGALADQTVVEFYVVASDSFGLTRNWPLSLDENGATVQGANALYQVDNSTYTGDQPINRIIMTESERAELENINRNTRSNARMNATFITRDGVETKVRYNVGVRIRGAGSRGRVPPNLRVAFPTDQRWNGVTDVNLNTQYTHSQIAGYALANLAGLNTESARIVQVRVNGQNLANSGSPQYSSYIQLEVPDGDFVKNHFPNDSNGNLYRAASGSHSARLDYLGTNPNNYINAGYSKQNNTSENDWSDLINLTQVLGYPPDATYEPAVRQVVNVDEWMVYFALFTLTESQETSLGTGQGDDFGLFRGVDDPRFILLAHDWDTILGEGDSRGNPATDIWRATALPAVAQFLRWPTFAPIYLGTLKRLSETTFSPKQVGQTLDQVLGDFVPTGTIANMKAFASNRVAYVLSQIPTNLTVDVGLSQANGYYRTTSAGVSLSGSGDAVATRSILVNGQPASWVAWQGSWSANVSLTPGLNRVEIQALGTNNVQVGERAVDIWYDDGSVADVSGSIATSTTWSAAGGPYRVTGSVTVPLGVTLTIAPGTTVYFANGAGLSVSGRLAAQGTAAQRIRLSQAPGSAQTNGWAGITFNNTMQDNVLEYADVEFAGSGGHGITANNSRLRVEHGTFAGTTQNHIEVDGSSFVIRDNRFSSLVGNELIHGSTIAAGGEGIVEGNIFGTTTGLNDIIDFSRAQRPGPVFQVLNNVFTGASDDVLDLDGCDTHVEGNVFMHVSNGDSTEGADTSSAISYGMDGGYAPLVVVVRNIFFDVDHAVLAKEGGWVKMENNTAVGVRFALVNFGEPQRGVAIGGGAVLDGDVYWNPAGYNGTNFENVVQGGMTASVTVNRSILAGTDGLSNGTGNSHQDPLLVRTDPNQVRLDNIWESFALRAGSPAAGTGPNGLDMGAEVPSGPSISGEPVGVTPSRNASLTIGGPGIDAYKYSVNGGSFSGETAVTVPVILNNLADGTYTVRVVGKNSAGVWQADAEAAVSRTWTVNGAAFGVRLNEILASNDSAVTYNGGYPDLIELHNVGSQPADLSGARLSDDAADPARFVFPAGTSIPAGGYLIVVADNNTGGTGPHTGFALSGGGEELSLYDQNGVLRDSVAFGPQLSDFSIGRGEDGAWRLNQPTFGADNIALPTGSAERVRINEWLADGRVSFPDDFIELYNGAPWPVDLGGSSLTDNPLNAPALSPIPPLSFIQGGGFLIYTADGKPGNGPAHVNFKLSPDRGMIGLFDSQAQLIDVVLYGPQTTDISQGRSPNGSDTLEFFVQPTPGSVNPDLSPLPPPPTVTLVPITQAWRYDDSGSDLGTSWRATSYNDASWPSGAGLLAMEDCNCLPTPINTVLNLGPTTYYFRTHFNVANPDFANLQIRTVLDDGAIFYLNGQEFFRLGMPNGTVTSSTLAGRTVVDASYEGPFTVPLTGLAQGDNVLAVEVHQNNFISDVVFGMILEGVENVSTVVTNVVINEVLANNVGLKEADGSEPDWIELFNPGTTPYDLGGMSLTDDASLPRRWVFPSGSSVPGLGYLVVRFDANSALSSTNTGFGLKANGGSVYLFKRPGDGGALLDAITYGLQAPDWSIGRVPNAGTSWNLTLPTPGSANVAAALTTPANLKINEWMASPASGEDWFELFNPNPQPVPLSGLYLTDDLTVRDQYQISPLSFIAPAPQNFLEITADSSPEKGADHTNFKLSAGGESIGLFAANGTAIDSVVFGPQQAGVSEGRLIDGSTNRVFFPGSASPGKSNYLPLTNVVVNEVLTHSDLPFEDAIELRNLTGAAVDISGWFISDSETSLEKFRVPNGTTIAPNGYLVFYEDQFNADPIAPAAFSFSSAHGDEAWLSAVDATGHLNGYRAGVKFGPAANAVSFGRYPTSVGVDFVSMSKRTFGADDPNTVEEFRTGTGLPNSGPLIGPVVISEIMYHPPAGGGIDNAALEFIELNNVSTFSIPLYDPLYPTNTWRLRSAVHFDFPANLTLAPGGYLVVVSFDPATDAAALAAFRSAYGVAPTVPIVGPYSGKLDNAGESVELYMPDPPQLPPSLDAGLVPYVLEDRVEYSSVDPWPVAADGTGASLQRVNPAAYGNDPINWMAAAPSPGPSLPDRDHDGIPDDWEATYGLNPDSAADASQDLDGDGLTNLQEYQAGTLPNDAASNLLADGVGHDGATQTVTFRFMAMPSRSYTVQYTEDLGSGRWFSLQNFGAQSSVHMVQVTDTPPPTAPRRFYRIVTPAVP